ncbi:hypothetical protein BC629DRAFT_1636682 [Irpex lacteus]|nr:hypothetical protein BC629DRAFT_1636682 [Irpex lacteus]
MAPKVTLHVSANAWATPLKIAPAEPAPNNSNANELAEHNTLPTPATTNDRSVAALEEGEIPTMVSGVADSMHAPWREVRSKSPSKSRPSTPATGNIAPKAIAGIPASRNTFDALHMVTLPSSPPTESTKATLPAKKGKGKESRPAFKYKEVPTKATTKGKKTFPPYDPSDSPLNRSRSKARKTRNASAPPPSRPDLDLPPMQSPTSMSQAFDFPVIKEEEEEADLWAGSHLDLTLEEEEEIQALEAQVFNGQMVVDDGGAPEAGPSNPFRYHVDEEMPSAPPDFLTYGVSQGEPLHPIATEMNHALPILCPQPQRPSNYSMPFPLEPVPVDGSSAMSSPSPSNVPPNYRPAAEKHHPTLSTLGSPITLRYPDSSDSRPQSAVPRQSVNIDAQPQPYARTQTRPRTTQELAAMAASIRRAYVEDAIDIDDEDSDGYVDPDSDDEDVSHLIIVQEPHTPNNVVLYNKETSVPDVNWTPITYDDPFQPLANASHPQVIAWPATKRPCLYVQYVGLGCPAPGEEDASTGKIVEAFTNTIGYIPTLRVIAPSCDKRIHGENQAPHSYLMHGFGRATRDYLLDLKCVSTTEATLIFKPIDAVPDKLIMTLAGFGSASPKKIIEMINKGFDSKNADALIARLAPTNPLFANKTQQEAVVSIRNSLRISISLVPGPYNTCGSVAIKWQITISECLFAKYLLKYCSY